MRLDLITRDWDLITIGIDANERDLGGEHRPIELLRWRCRKFVDIVIHRRIAKSYTRNDESQYLSARNGMLKGDIV